MELLATLLKILMFIGIFIVILSFVLLSMERRFYSKIAENIGTLNEKYEKRLIKLKYRQYYAPKARKKGIVESYDILIGKSNLRKYIPFLSGEIMIIASVIVAIFAFIWSMSYLHNIFSSLVISGFAVLVIKLILKIIANYNASKTDDQLLSYIDILENFCSVEDNIVFAIERAIPFTKEPLQSFSEAFIYEVKHGIPLITALENFKSKIENKKFKNLLKNIQLCAKNSGSYIKTLRKSKKIIQKYTEERGRRKKDVRDARKSILSMIFISLVIIYGLIGINPNLPDMLKSDLTGQLIVTFNIFIYLFGVYKSITLEKFEY